MFPISLVSLLCLVVGLTKISADILQCNPVNAVNAVNQKMQSTSKKILYEDTLFAKLIVESGKHPNGHTLHEALQALKHANELKVQWFKDAVFNIVNPGLAVCLILESVFRAAEYIGPLIINLYRTLKSIGEALLAKKDTSQTLLNKLATIVNIMKTNLLMLGKQVNDSSNSIKKDPKTSQVALQSITNSYINVANNLKDIKFPKL